MQELMNELIKRWRAERSLSQMTLGRFISELERLPKDKEIENVYQKAEAKWDGHYETLDGNCDKYTTHINVERFRDLVYKCIQKADDLNQNSDLELRLSGGVRQLFFDYIRSLDKIKTTANN